MAVESRIWGAVPFAAMVLVEIAEIGVSTISKAAMSKGMSHFVFIVYYNALGTLLLFPYFIFQRNRRAPLSFKLICRFFLLGLIGSSGKILFFAGVKYSSPTLSAALANLTPIFTFLLAIIFRMEKLDLRQTSGQAKSLGTIISVGGALIVTFYKGPAVLMASLKHAGFKNQHIHSQHSAWVFGGLLLAIQCVVSSSWNIAQAATVKDYPEEMTIVFFYTLFLTIQCSVISLFVEWKNPSAWKLEPGIEMVAIVYAAIFVSVFRIGVHVWCLHKKGPVYVAMFKPLGIAIAVAMVVIFLGDTLYLGSVIGSVVISLGFYTVIWAQIKEKKRVPGVFFKAAASRGLSYCVLIVYSHAIDTIVLLPLPFIFRRTGLPPFKLSLIFKLFLLGIIGMEKLNWRSRSTQAKVMGTLVSISGAIVVVLYKGPTILSPTTPSFLGISEMVWVNGGLLLTLGYLLFSVWAILQTHIMKTYPDELVLAFLYNLCGTIVSAPTCIIVEKNLIAWKLTSAFGILVHIWGMHMKGPVYVASFKPLSIVIAAASSFIFLGDDLYLGSIVGAIVLSIGFYVWGKAKEEILSEDSTGKTPLMVGYKSIEYM
ncbi:hypothetical protein ACLB2K_057937 [Fragaria x ananassa]